MNGGEERLPVVLVAGLHAEARQAAVEGLLRAVPGAVALHHDLSAAASEGSVRRTVRSHEGALDEGEAPLVNNCACCALREDLVPELLRLADSRTCALAVVELWDSVEPQAMAEVVAAHSADALEVTGVLTAVDPALVLPYLAAADDLSEAGLAAAPTDERTVADTFARQLEYAPVLVLAGGEEEADDADRELLRQLHPVARRVRAEDGAELGRAATEGFDVGAAAARQYPACALLPQEADAEGVTTFVWRARRPFHPARLHAALQELACVAVRSRGRFWLADRPDTLLSWDAAGGALCVEERGPWLAALPDAAWEMVPPVRRAAAALDWHPVQGDRGQHLVFTAPGLDTDGLGALLDSCVLTDAEHAGGPEAWRRYAGAFDDLLSTPS
ncbi:GTP-binding protein [Streptomyces albiaxialis]|uniref:GTP-binding protein n=1 Tax=Streptomyces albiaxialis TaxID=329523 RepID=A0ABN2VIS8_9ACTN